GPGEFCRRVLPGTILAPRSLQREHGALRVDASGNPAATRQFDWSLGDAAATALHAFSSHVDIPDIEIIKPERDWRPWKFGEDAADRLSAGGEQLVRIHEPDLGGRWLPAKNVAVE